MSWFRVHGRLPAKCLLTSLYERMEIFRLPFLRPLLLVLGRHKPVKLDAVRLAYQHVLGRSDVRHWALSRIGTGYPQLYGNVVRTTAKLDR